MPQFTLISGIYIIVNTQNGNVYVGQAQNVQARWKVHRKRLLDGHHQNTHLQRAWDKYGEQAFEFQILEYCAIDQLHEREMHYIAIYKAKNTCYNMTDGGGGTRGRKHSEDTRRKLSAAARNRSEEARRKISEGRKGKHPSEETRQKMSASRTGKKRQPHQIRRGAAHPRFGKTHTPEARQKIREARQRKGATRFGAHTEETRRKQSEIAKQRPPFSEEHRRKMGDARRGRKHSEETRRKMSEKSRARPPISEETRQKMREAANHRSEEHNRRISESKRGKKPSEESRRKMSEAGKRRAERERAERNLQPNTPHTDEDA